MDLFCAVWEGEKCRTINQEEADQAKRDAIAIERQRSQTEIQRVKRLSKTERSQMQTEMDSAIERNQELEDCRVYHTEDRVPIIPSNPECRR